MTARDDLGTKPLPLRYPVVRTSCVLIGLGVPGVLSLLLAVPEIAGVPRWALLINPAIFLIISAFIGSWAAPRCGLRSLVADRLAGIDRRVSVRYLAATLAIGVVLGLLVALFDQVTAPLWHGSSNIPALGSAWSPAVLLFGVLYGGIVEEIMMRWGIMSLVVWIVWRVAAHSSPVPTRWALVIGGVVSALLFAAGHLPAAAATSDLTLPLVFRIVGLNTVVGLVLAFLFATRNLESSISAHMGFHVGVAAAAILLVIL
jgi:membrane protease YdiL (CAAX protease family)